MSSDTRTSRIDNANREDSTIHNSPRTYYIVYGALLGLLALTVLGGVIGLRAPWGLIVALTIAVAKALLVILYFMHVRDSSRTTWLFVAAGFTWLAILFALTLSDYLSRGWFGA
ncbi:MAG: cytochrome C oxidase subunit IV family protein [Caldilineaceae bacterium]